MVIKKILSAVLAAAAAIQMLGIGAVTSNYSPLVTVASAANSNVEYSDEFKNYIISSLENLPSKIDVLAYADEFDYSTTKLLNAFLDILESDPTLFYVKQSAKCSYSKSSSTGKYVSFTLKSLKYTGTKAEIEAQKEELDEAVDKVLESCVSDDMKTVEKALAVHDHIILNTQYDTNYYKSGYTRDQLQVSAYDCLVEGVAVCEGYSAAYKLIMNKLGIDCEVIRSDSMDHAWNYIKIGSKWYHVDLTHDDPLMNKKYDNLGKVSHENFLLSDTAIKKTGHSGWDTKDLPTATSTTYDNYFWRDVTAGMFYVDGLWYYAQTDSSTSGLKLATKIKTFDFTNKKLKTIATIPSVWLVWNTTNSFWKESYLRLAEADGKIYYNTSDTIYCYSPETGKTETFFKPSTKNGYVYGITISDDTLYYAIKTSPNDEDNIKSKEL